MAQTPAPSACLQGVIRDSEGKPAVQVLVRLQRSDSSENFQAQTDSAGKYAFPRVPDGVYRLSAIKDGQSAGEIPSLFLKPGEAKNLDFTMRLQPGTQAASASSPQFFDEPQFTVAGVTDTTNLGGHGPDTVVRTRDSLAKETVSMGDPAQPPAVDAERGTRLRKAADRQPEDFQANHQMGAWLLANGSPGDAIRFLERAAAKDPANYDNALDLARANAHAGNYSEAKNQVTKLLATKDDADLHHLLADVDEKLGDSLDAVRHYQRAAELAPTESHLFDWGANLLLHHAPEPAIQVFSKANHLFPSSTRVLLGLGAAAFAQGAYDQAVRYISRASDLNPGDPAPYQFLGKIVQAQNTPSDELIEKLHRFLTLLPRRADANYYYALGLWKLTRTASGGHSNAAEVESLLQTAIQIDPKCAPAALQLGIVHSDHGQYPEAIANFRKALAADSHLEEAHFRLAQAYRETGDSDKAKQELQLYTQLTKESEQKQERERHEIKQFVYTLRDSPQAQ